MGTLDSHQGWEEGLLQEDLSRAKSNLGDTGMKNRNVGVGPLPELQPHMAALGT